MRRIRYSASRAHRAGDIVWVVHGVLLLAAPLPVLLSPLGDLTGLAYVSLQIFVTTALLVLFVPLMTLPILLRDRGAVGAVLWSTPLDATAHYAGLAIGSWLALVPPIGLQVAARWVLGTALPEVAPLALWMIGLPVMLVAAFAASAVTMLLAALLRRALPVLLVWIPLWLAPIAPIYDLAGTDALLLRSPLNLYGYVLELSPALGLGPSAPLVLGLAGWFIALGLMLATRALVAGVALEEARSTRWAVLLSLITVLAVGAAVAGFRSHTLVVAALAPRGSPADVQLDVWQVVEHELEAVVAGDRIDGRSTLTLEAAAPKDRLVLRLDPGLDLTAVVDEAERPVAVSRQGDSVVVELAAPATAVSVTLRWHGRPLLPYSDHGHRHVVSPVPTMKSPQPVRSFLSPDVAFLMRDGDWYPWPWRTDPHQAARSEVRLWAGHPRAVATTALEPGLRTWSWAGTDPALVGGRVATWEGPLPNVLLVVPPPRGRQVEGVGLHHGAWSGAALARRLEHFAAAAVRLARALDEEPPRHVVALPYLHDVVWGGEIVLVPEGTGMSDFLRRSRIEYALWVRGPPELEERAALVALGRAWIAARAPVPRTVVWSDANPENLPIAGEGRWVEAEAFARRGIVGPPSVPGTQGLAMPADGVVAFAVWLALELAPDEVRSADLRAIREAVHGPRNLRHRLLPPEVGLPDTADLVLGLVAWAARVGPAVAVRSFVDVVRSMERFDLRTLVDRLGAARDVAPIAERSGRADHH